MDITSSLIYSFIYPTTFIHYLSIFMFYFMSMFMYQIIEIYTGIFSFSQVSDGKLRGISRRIKCKIRQWCQRSILLGEADIIEDLGLCYKLFSINFTGGWSCVDNTSRRQMDNAEFFLPFFPPIGGCN